MYRIFSNKRPIFGMAISRSRAMDEASRYKDEIVDHIMKAVIYEDSFSDWNHWLHEISNWLFQASDIQIKSKSGKLTAKDYLNTTFSSFGETRNDAIVLLRGFNKQYVKSGKYPKFEMTVSLADALTFAFIDIAQTFSRKFSKSTKYSINAIHKELDEILKNALQSKDIDD